MATKQKQQQSLLQHDQQRKESIRKLFETKKNLPKTITTTTNPRSISYTNLENATIRNNLAEFQSESLSQSNGQIASQQLQYEDKILQQQYEDEDEDIASADDDYAFENVRRNSCTTSSTKIKRWHVVGHKGNDVTKDIKLAKSLLGPNQLPTTNRAKEIPIALHYATKTNTNATTAAAVATLAKSISTNSLTKQHNQLVIRGSMGFLNTSLQPDDNDDYHQKEFKANNHSIDKEKDKQGVFDNDGYNNCFVATNSSCSLNNNYKDSCPAATTITTPKARRPSKHWFKRKNWYSQDDADDFNAPGYNDDINDGRQTFLNKQLQLPQYSQPIYDTTDYRTITNKNVNNYKNISNETENYLTYNNNNDSIYHNSKMQENVTNEFSSLQQDYEDNNEDYNDNNYDPYKRTDINFGPTNWQPAIQQTNDKDKYFYNNSKDLRIADNNNTSTNENYYDDDVHNNNVAVTENFYKTEMSLGHAAVCQNENKKSHNSKNQQPQFTTNEQQSTQTATATAATKTSYSTPSSPTLKQLMKIKLKTKSQEIVINDIQNATEANSKLFSNNQKLYNQENPSTTNTASSFFRSTLDSPRTLNSLNVIQDSNNAGFTQKLQLQHDYQLDQHHHQDHQDFKPQHQQYLPTSSLVAVTDVNEYNSYNNVYKDKNPLLNDR